MNIEFIKSEFEKLTLILRSWKEGHNISTIERDIVLDKLKNIYDAVRFADADADADSVGSQCLRRRVDACLPHEQGADRLRCVPFGAMVRVDGGRPTSRGLPPAAFWGTGDGEMSAVPQKGILKGLDP